MNYNLYGGVPPHENTRTSEQAALKILPNVKTLQAKVLRYLCKRPSTDDHVEMALGLRHQTASARRRELVLMGLVEDSGAVTKTRSGRNATIWKVTPFGHSVVRLGIPLQAPIIMEKNTTRKLMPARSR